MSAAPSIPESTATLEAARASLLYERYSGKILGYCRRRLSSREEAEDAVQHIFLNAYRSLRTGVVPHAEAAWLYKIAENVCHERRRSAWRRSRIELVSDDGEMRDAVAAPVHEHDELEGLADALAELTPNQRRAILLREWQGLTYREIATELETTESAVETLLFRARGSLARKLDRSRGRVLSGLNLGSLVAWGKSLLGGAALKIAAATLVVAAGVAVATPSLRHQVAVGGSQGSMPTSAPAPAFLQSPLSAGAVTPSSNRFEAAPAGVEPREHAARPAGPTAEAHVPTPAASSPGTHPGAVPVPVSENVPAPVAVDVPGTVPVTLPPVPPLPVNVEVPPVPPVPPLPVEVPPLPPVPPVSVPDLPSLPPAPDLPKLP
jgi:RNA polymerase sigma factor (sigma-70 family)